MLSGLQLACQPMLGRWLTAWPHVRSRPAGHVLPSTGDGCSRLASDVRARFGGRFADQALRGAAPLGMVAEGGGRLTVGLREESACSA
jgi:hypothetical protein